MPAIHKFKFKDKVLTFQDSDIVDVLAEEGIRPSEKLDHRMFLAAAFGAALNCPDVEAWDADLYSELLLSDEESISKGFEFAMSSLVQEVYGL